MLPTENSSDNQPVTKIPDMNSSLIEKSSEPSDGHLLIIQDDRGRRRLILESDIYSIGRDHHCDIRLYSQFVSRRHATLMRIRCEDGKDSYRIVDGTPDGSSPSANGLMINRRKFKTYDLQNQEEIVFGPQVRAVYYRVHRGAFQEP